MEGMNTALSLVVALGAYCPRVKLSDEKTLALEKAKAKRRTRPMTGRGSYGKTLMAHFDGVNGEKKAAKKYRQMREAA